MDRILLFMPDLTDLSISNVKNGLTEPLAHDLLLALYGADEEEFRACDVSECYQIHKGAYNLLKLRLSEINLNFDSTVELLHGIITKRKQLTSLDLSWTCLGPK